MLNLDSGIKKLSFILNKISTSKDIITAVKKDGFCVIPDYLPNKDLESLTIEFEQIIDRKYSKGFYEHACRDYMEAIAVSGPDMMSSTFTAQKKLLTKPQLEELTQLFYGDSYQYPFNIFNVRSTYTPAKSEELPYCMHFDKHQMFKFFFLLSDTDENCGPTWVIPGKQQEVRHIRNEWYENNNPVRRIDNKLIDHDNEAIPLIGKAGSLVILDTDTPHKAGKVAKNKVREVIRISTTCPIYSGL